VDAFVYLRVQPGKVEDVVVQLQGARGVRAAVAVVGDWDVLAAVHGSDLIDVAEVVLRAVHRTEGVERTVTAPVVPGDVLGLAGGGLGTPVPMQRPGDACFVHVRAMPEAATGLVETIAELDEISAVAMIGGEYDVIAEIPYPWEQAARVIVEHLLPLPGVLGTNTLVAVPHLEPEDEDRDQFSAWT
jgi:DNA-binding Lrp family transcriptional regulator